MKTLKITAPRLSWNKYILPFAMGLLLVVLLWQSLPILLQRLNTEVGLVDNGIWQLLLFALICYILMLGISILLLKSLLKGLGLANINTMVSQFKTLSSWQQFVLYWASFALLLLAAVGCLVAVM